MLSPGEDYSSHSQHSLALAVLCVGLMPDGFSLIYFGMSLDIVLVQLMHWLSCWWDFMEVASDVIRRSNHTENSQLLWLLHFLSLFCIVPRALGEGLFCRGIHWEWAPQSAFSLLVVFYSVVYSKEKFAGWWLPYLPAVRTNVYSVARDYAALVMQWL